MLHQSANLSFPSLQRKVILITQEHNFITPISNFLLSGPSRRRDAVSLRPRPLILQGAEELTDKQTDSWQRDAALPSAGPPSPWSPGSPR